MLTLSDYQKEALKTSDETNTLEYCVLGLVSEAGEVAGVVKKWLRGDYDEETMRAKMLDELGDVLWYVAVTADRAGCYWGDVLNCSHRFGESGLLRSVSYLIEEASGPAESVFQSSEDVDPYSLAAVWQNVKRIGKECGHSLESIAAHNIAKLRDRQERGVIRGSGDGR